MKKLWKKLTIRRRASNLGFFLVMHFNPVTCNYDPNWPRVRRALLRINLIKHGRKPFTCLKQSDTKIGNVYYWPSILKGMGF